MNLPDGSHQHEHTHDHEHGHGAEHGGQFGDGHFDERAATWDENPGHAERAAVLADAIAGAVALDPATRVLEYGAGTGLVSQALRASAGGAPGGDGGAGVGPLTLADTSAGMREVMQRKIDAGVITDATVWDVDLAVDPPPAGAQFDLIVTVLTLHHIEHLAPVLDAFAALLAPDGHLCIADLEEEDGSFHGEGFHGHHGFSRSGLTDALAAAGFAAPTFTTPYHIERENGSFPVFLAVARRN